MAILRSARDDIEGGHLTRVENLVAADLFTDFLEMAEDLLRKGCYQPAAMLTGAVLEEGLRKIAVANEVKVRDGDKIGTLNQKLANGGVYNRLRQKQVDTWKAVRDLADHGKFGEFGETDVADMLRGVRDFLAGQME